MLMLFGNCYLTKNEFQAWRYKRDVNGQPRQGDDQFEDANNDLLDGICGAAALNLSPSGSGIRLFDPRAERQQAQTTIQMFQRRRSGRDPFKPIAHPPRIGI